MTTAAHTSQVRSRHHRSCGPEAAQRGLVGHPTRRSLGRCHASSRNGRRSSRVSPRRPVRPSRRPSSWPSPRDPPRRRPPTGPHERCLRCVPTRREPRQGSRTPPSHRHSRRVERQVVSSRSWWWSPSRTRMSWRTPDTYQKAGTERGTATITSTKPGTTSLPASSVEGNLQMVFGRNVHVCTVRRLATHKKRSPMRSACTAPTSVAWNVASAT